MKNLGWIILIISSILMANEEILEIRKQIDILSKRLETLEKQSQQNNQVSSAENHNKSDNRGTLELSRPDTVLGVGGRIELRTVLASPDGEFAAGKIPLERAAQKGNGELRGHVRESRLWFKSRTPTHYGPLRSLIEVDFFGSEGSETNTNGHGLRLRHAYAQVGGWSVGQTNSAFNSMVSLDTVTSVINDTMVRQPLVMYTHNHSLEWAYDLSFEQPETTLIDKNGTIITPKNDRFPDIIARIRHYPSWGEASFAVMGRYLTQNQTTLSDGTQMESRDSVWGYGANGSVRIKTVGEDDLRIDLQYGRGIGRYLAYNAFAGGYIDDSGKITLQRLYGGHIGYRHFWNSTLRSTLAYGFVAAQAPSGLLHTSDKATKKGEGWHLNLLWSPFDNAITGFEYSQGRREMYTKDEGEMETGMVVFRYDF